MGSARAHMVSRTTHCVSPSRSLSFTTAHYSLSFATAHCLTGLALTRRRYNQFASLHEHLHDEAERRGLARALPPLPPKRYGGGASLVQERTAGLGEYLQQLVLIAQRQFAETDLAQCVIAPLDTFLGLAGLEETELFGYSQQLSAFVHGASGAWSHARQVDAAARCVQLQWRVCLAQRREREQRQAQRHAQALLYSARLEQCPTPEKRLPLLLARGECYLGAAAYEAAHADGNAALSLLSAGEQKEKYRTASPAPPQEQGQQEQERETVAVKSDGERARQFARARALRREAEAGFFEAVVAMGASAATPPRSSGAKAKYVLDGETGGGDGGVSSSALSPLRMEAGSDDVCPDLKCEASLGA
eukprot:COSAG05_NODE_2331_length_3231_cov_2.128000_1_plen_362_part_00